MSQLRLYYSTYKFLKPWKPKHQTSIRIYSNLFLSGLISKSPTWFPCMWFINHARRCEILVPDFRITMPGCHDWVKSGHASADLMQGQSGAAVRDDLTAMVGQLWRKLSVAYLPNLSGESSRETKKRRQWRGKEELNMRYERVAQACQGSWC